ncbi:MFS general substrate transporter [Teratosphaeria destructans]|uniref:MFS general substrate transporter n=1 Tax=Teratosphaeria destructans TaxID=418781 RepID=A0A9W7VZ04_9PEZI|nr:MFS general substrate transporter [Teratosphaeria destructans]
MVPIDMNESVPGTEYLIDLHRDNDVSHNGRSDVVLLPQPTHSGADTLRWRQAKKYWHLFLLALYACAFSFGENTLGAAWTTVSEDTGVSIDYMNAGSALNYLLLGFGNIFWIPAAMKLGRRPVFLATTAICLGAAIWTGSFHGLAQWFLSQIMNGVGTSAYQAVIQLSIFDMFFVHERGRALTCYLFGQQLGSIIGLITGGRMADTVGWRWSQYIVAIIEGFVFVLMLFSFEETLFPRFLFPSNGASTFDANTIQLTAYEDHERRDEVNQAKRAADAKLPPSPPCGSFRADAGTGLVTYFVRPFFLFGFPNVVISGLIFAFGCTAGIVTFNTISEVLTSKPYDFTTTATGLMFLAALVGNIVGLATGVLGDYIVLRLARRNGGVKEPEMRLWTLCISSLYAATGYFLYGWGAEEGANWSSIAFGIGCVISHQVSACSVATAYAMECFPGISGELVVVLAICSSCVNFAISYSVQPFIDAAGYGWVFTFYGVCVVLSMAAAVPMMWWGKSWRRRCAKTYCSFLDKKSKVHGLD